MHRYDSPRRALALGIAALAGFVDATGFIATGRYFVSFMSGNTTRFGVDLATDAIRALIPGLLILGFVCGVVIGALLVRRAGEWRKTVVIGTTALLILGSALGRASGVEPVFLGCSVLAMGVINNAFQRDGEVAVGLTYMTGALVRFGQGLAARLCGEMRPGWFLNIVLWASLALGAVGGAAAARGIPRVAPWISVAAAALLFLCALLIERRNRHPQSS